MGKTKILTIGDTQDKTKLSSEEEYKLKQDKKAEKEVKKKAQEKKVHLPGQKGGERIKLVEAEPAEEVPSADAKVGVPGYPGTLWVGGSDKQVPQTKTKAKKVKVHGKKYLAARAKVDPTKTYSISEATQLVKETSISKFDGSVELHLVLNKDNVNQNVDLPNSTGKTKRVEVASEDTVKKLEAGKIDFDVLIASPATMPKLVRFAKLLGPRGLMPNPKNGTLVDDPKKSAEMFSGNSIRVRTEKEAPLIHLVVAKVSQPELEIEENIKSVINAVGPKTVTKAVISASMGPAIRLAI